jgi:hypothetical protein
MNRPYYAIDELERAFSVAPDCRETQNDDAPSASEDCRDRATLRALLNPWSRAILSAAGSREFPSPSEADMALVTAMAHHGLTRDEMWLLLDESPRLADRAKRKGEERARSLYDHEIAKALELISRETEEDRSSSEAPRLFRLVGDGEIETLPPARWLIRKVLPLGTLGVLYGQAATAKTFTALSMAYAIASGSPWMELPVDQGSVVYLLAEAAEGLGLRTRAWKKAYGVSGRPPVNFLFESVDLLNPRAVDRLVATLQALPTSPALVVVDVLARYMVGADENSTRDMGLTVAALERVRTTLGCTVLVLHHTNQDGTRERGNTALRGAADTMIKLTKKAGAITMTCDKQRSAAPFGKLGFRLKVVQLDAEHDSCVIERLPSDGDGSDTLPDNQWQALRALAVIPKGRPYSRWHKASHLKETTFRRVMRRFEALEYVAKREDRYVVTETGRRAFVANNRHRTAMAAGGPDQ